MKTAVVKPETLTSGGEIDMETLQKKLKRLFYYYADFGDRNNTQALKLMLLMKLLKEANLIDDSLINKRSVELMYKNVLGANYGKLDFEKFQIFIIKLAKEKFPQIPEKEAVLKIIQGHLIPLYEHVYSKTLLGFQLDVMEDPLDPVSLRILEHIQDALTVIYKAYFIDEYNDLRKNIGNKTQLARMMKSLEEKSYLILSQILKDFEIYGPILSLNLTNFMYNELIDDERLKKGLYFTNSAIAPNQGRRFTLHCFFAFILKAPILGYSPVFNQAMPEYHHLANGEKLALMLERMEQSIGMEKLGLHAQSTRSGKWHLALPDAFLRKLFPNSIALYDPSLFTKGKKDATGITTTTVTVSGPSSSSLMSNISQMHSSRETKSFENLKNWETLKIFEPHARLLQDIFTQYCAVHQEHTNYMSMITLHKFFKEIGLVKNINEASRAQAAGEMVMAGLDLDLLTLQAKNAESQVQYAEDETPMIITTPGETLKRKQVVKGVPIPIEATAKKVGFATFLHLIELITLQLLPNVPLVHSLPQILKEFIFPMAEKLAETAPMRNSISVQNQASEERTHLREKSVFRDHEMIRLMALAKQYIRPYFLQYAIGEGNEVKPMLSFEEVAAFCKDFCICPQIVHLQRLRRCFNLVHIINKSSTAMSKSIALVGNDLLSVARAKAVTTEKFASALDEDLFMDLLVLLSMQNDTENAGKSNADMVNNQFCAVLTHCRVVHRANPPYARSGAK
jgi:hypothetical protein